MSAREYEGEAHQMPLQPEVHPDDRCGCLKPPGCYGKRGWHFNAAGEVVERCPRAPKRPARKGRRR